MKIATILSLFCCLCHQHHGASAQDYLNNPYFNFVPANEQFPITSYVESFPNEPIQRDNPAAWTGSGIISYDDEEEDQFLPGKIVDKKLGFGPRRRRKKRELLDCATPATKTKDSTSLLSKVIRSNKIFIHSEIVSLKQAAAAQTFGMVHIACFCKTLFPLI